MKKLIALSLVGACLVSLQPRQAEAFGFAIGGGLVVAGGVLVGAARCGLIKENRDRFNDCMLDTGEEVLSFVGQALGEAKEEAVEVASSAAEAGSAAVAKRIKATRMSVEVDPTTRQSGE